MPTVTKVSFETAKQLMDAHPDHRLFDVREEEEYVTGHAAGALLFPLDSMDAATAAQMIPEKDTPVLVYCRSGQRSGEAAQKLAQLGYTRVYDIGSLVGWPYGMDW
jgi:phage shock protein E